MKNKKSGIYCIENIINGKKYIGQTINLERREKEHFSLLKGNCHDNIHLQNAYNKYGKKNFKFRILLYCKPFELTKYEQIFVDFYTPETLYNVRLECVNSNQGMIFSKETKKKMSEAKRGKHRSKETKEKLSKANSGKHHPMYGKHHSKETIRKMSKAKRGKNSPMYGKHHSKEARRKISEANSEENCYSSKLTKNQVFEVLDLYYNENKKQTDIAKIFPVNNVAISYIVRGKCWKSCYRKFMENNKEKYGNKS